MSYYGAHRPPPSVPRTDFGPAPPGYIPGIGRGAVGFTTRSDIGPAKPMQEEQVVGRSRVLPIPPLPLGYGARQTIPTVAPAPTSAAAAAGILSTSTAATAATVPAKPGSAESEPAAGSGGAEAADAKAEALEAVKYSDANYDEFGGYNERLFASGDYDAEDKEADAIYAAIDRRVEGRGKRKRDDDSKGEGGAEGGSSLDKIHSRFSDVKRKLSSISEAEWMAIPESMDVSRRNALVKAKDNSREKFTPLPDSILTSSAAIAQTLPTLNTNTAATPAPTTTTAAPVDLTSIGRARDKMLGLRLDRLGDSVSGQTVVDPKGYMTELGTQKINTAAEVSDIKKARLLMHSVIDSNPTLPSGYIGLSRIEKDTGRLKEAREAIMRGCEACPQSEDVWIEAALLHAGKAARSVVAKAIQHLPQSIQLWMLAARLEVTADEKKAVLRRALELLPNSIGLWKAAVEMEDEEGARVLLGRAVELVPESVEMWLALARLSSYDEARGVLNRARKAVPTDSSIWITAAKLEEANGKAVSVPAIIEKAVRSLQAYEVRIDRDYWLNEAESAERSGAAETCKAIVAATLGLGVDELDRRNTWLNDAAVYEARGALHTARAVHAQLLQHFADKKSLWIKAAQFEKSHGTPEQLRSLLARAVEACPRADLLWLMYAKEQWVAGRVGEARAVLDRAHGLNAASEEVWLAAMKIEFECGEYERARTLLAHARDKCRSARVWMKSAKLERVLGERDRERALLDEALRKWRDEWKLWLMKAQWLQRAQPLDAEAVRDTYKQAVKHCPTVAVLWVEYAKFEMALVQQPSSGVSQSSALARARAILETARLKVPKSPLLWLTTMRVESAGQSSAAASTNAFTHSLARALQECPTSGLIHAAAILSSARPQRRSVSHEALKRCTDDAAVFEAVARLLWSEGKLGKAREWFERAVRVSGAYGDVWVWWYRMECEAGGDSAAADVRRRCVERDPTHGEVWTGVSKADRYVRCKAGEVLEVAAHGLVEILPGERIVVRVRSEAENGKANGVKKEHVDNGVASAPSESKQNGTAVT